MCANVPYCCEVVWNDHQRLLSFVCFRQTESSQPVGHFNQELGPLREALQKKIKIWTKMVPTQFQNFQWIWPNLSKRVDITKRANVKIRTKKQGGRGREVKMAKISKFYKSYFWVASPEAVYISPNNPWSEVLKNNVKLTFAGYLL